MKIVSRPESSPVGEGDFTLNMTFEQLQYMAAVLGITRLGHGSVYKKAAFELMGILEELFDSHFIEESCEAVDMVVSHVDGSCSPIMQFHNVDACLEV